VRQHYFWILIIFELRFGLGLDLYGSYGQLSCEMCQLIDPMLAHLLN
jgi:hypothetical protein